MGGRDGFCCLSSVRVSVSQDILAPPSGGGLSLGSGGRGRVAQEQDQSLWLIKIWYFVIMEFFIDFYFLIFH